MLIEISADFRLVLRSNSHHQALITQLKRNNLIKMIKKKFNCHIIRFDSDKVIVIQRKLFATTQCLYNDTTHAKIKKTKF